MKKPGLPEDEEVRMEALKSLNILDTPPEERFDRLTRLANDLFHVPVALVSLVDGNRQWFKSSLGLPVSETPRDISFCGHAILGDDIFVINDATKDKRFIDNPLVVTDPNIRFYAGCPLKSLNGRKLGTMCIIDRKPRKFGTREKAILEDLAAMVEREIELTQLATVDELTNIPNRRGFMALAEKSLQLCLRKELPASLVFMDLNKFKYINDTYGHAEGDRVLNIFADNIKNVSRDSDVFARFGGDEFVILFTDASKEVASSIIARFKNGLDDRCLAESLEYEILFSFGIVEYQAEAYANIEELLKQGDALMYRQKKANNQ